MSSLKPINEVDEPEEETPGNSSGDSSGNNSASSTPSGKRKRNQSQQIEKDKVSSSDVEDENMLPQEDCKQTPTKSPHCKKAATDFHKSPANDCAKTIPDAQTASLDSKSPANQTPVKTPGFKKFFKKSSSKSPTIGCALKISKAQTIAKPNPEGDDPSLRTPPEEGEQAPGRASLFKKSSSKSSGKSPARGCALKISKAQTVAKSNPEGDDPSLRTPLEEGEQAPGRASLFKKSSSKSSGKSPARGCAQTILKAQTVAKESNSPREPNPEDDEPSLRTAPKGFEQTSERTSPFKKFPTKVSSRSTATSACAQKIKSKGKSFPPEPCSLLLTQSNNRETSLQSGNQPTESKPPEPESTQEKTPSESESLTEGSSDAVPERSEVSFNLGSNTFDNELTAKEVLPKPQPKK